MSFDTGSESLGYFHSSADADVQGIDSDDALRTGVKL
jgi:hypothetical protein